MKVIEASDLPFPVLVEKVTAALRAGLSEGELAHFQFSEAMWVTMQLLAGPDRVAEVVNRCMGR